MNPVNDWQIAKHLYTYLEGTDTRLKYVELDWAQIVNETENDIEELTDTGAGPSGVSAAAKNPTED